MTISMTEVLAQFSEMSSLRVEMHRDKRFNGKYVQLWALTVLDGPNTVTGSRLLYHDSEMNGFLQYPENSFVRPLELFEPLWDTAAYIWVVCLLVCLQHPQL